MTRPMRPLVLVCSALLAHLLAPGPAAADLRRPVPSAGTPKTETATLLRDLDQRAAAAAAACPHLTFPARIGVARIEGGAVTSIPADEWTAWRALRDQMQATLGELRPVSPIVAQSLTTAPVSSTPHDAITNLRLAAAREQLDAILLYEISATQVLKGTELALLDATIIGAWWFPTHKSHAAAHASATLIDVRSGLAYGSAIGNASDVSSATRLGSGERIHRQRAGATRRAVEALAPEVGRMLTQLVQSPPRHYAPGEGASPAPRPAPASAPAGRPPAGDTDRIIRPPAEAGDSFWGSR